MKPFPAAVAATLFLALAGPASAQQMYTPMAPQVLPQPQPSYDRGPPPWAVDDGSSSDYPTHMPGDFGVADRLNAQIRAGNDANWYPPPPPPPYPGPPRY